MTTEISHHVELVVHVDESLNNGQRSHMEETLVATRGISRAHFNKNRPHLMIVEYDPDETSSINVLSEIRREHVHAELIGPV